MSAEAPGSSEDHTRRKAQWRQADVKRALVAAEQAGLQSYRVEIAPDGTISIVVGDPADTSTGSVAGGPLLDL